MTAQTIDSFISRSGGSVYRLVRLASLRALELAEGKPALIKTHNPDKLATIALDEIEAGLVFSKEATAFMAAEEKAKVAKVEE